MRLWQEVDKEILDQSRSNWAWSIWQFERSILPTRGKRQPKLVTLVKQLLERSMISSLSKEARPRNTVVQAASSTCPYRVFSFASRSQLSVGVVRSVSEYGARIL